MIPSSKHRSVRHLRPFPESMHGYLSDIDRALYAAEIACGDFSESRFCRSERECTFKEVDAFPGLAVCRRKVIREVIGEHVEQNDCEDIK